MLNQGKISERLIKYATKTRDGYCISAENIRQLMQVEMKLDNLEVYQPELGSLYRVYFESNDTSPVTRHLMQEMVFCALSNRGPIYYDLVKDQLYMGTPLSIVFYEVHLSINFPCNMKLSDEKDEYALEVCSREQILLKKIIKIKETKKEQKKQKTA